MKTDKTIANNTCRCLNCSANNRNSLYYRAKIITLFSCDKGKMTVVRTGNIKKVIFPDFKAFETDCVNTIL